MIGQACTSSSVQLDDLDRASESDTAFLRATLISLTTTPAVPGRTFTVRDIFDCVRGARGIVLYEYKATLCSMRLRHKNPTPQIKKLVAVAILT